MTTTRLPCDFLLKYFSMAEARVGCHSNAMAVNFRKRRLSTSHLENSPNVRDNRVAAIDFPLSKTTTPRLRFIAWFAAIIVRSRWDC